MQRIFRVLPAMPVPANLDAGASRLLAYMHGRLRQTTDIARIGPDPKFNLGGQHQ